MDEDIQTFINGLNAKDVVAWEKLYLSYYSPLCHYAMKILHDKELVEDLVQTAIVYLWESSLHFENIAAFNVYLYKIVNNNCLKELRNRERRELCLKSFAFFNDEINSECLSVYMHEEVIRKLRNVIDKMPHKRKEVILMSMQKMTNEEISRKLDISLNTVKKHKKGGLCLY